jgi:hypothetical protein
VHRAYGPGPSEETGTTASMDRVCQTDTSDKETRSSSRQQERVEAISTVSYSRARSEWEFPWRKALRHFSAPRDCLKFPHAALKSSTLSAMFPVALCSYW